MENGSQKLGWSSSSSNSGMISGSGTTNYIAKFTSASSIGNSIMFDDGSSVGVGIFTGFSARFNVKGTGNTSATYTSNFQDKNGRALLNVRDDGIIEVGQITSSTSVLSNNLVIGLMGVALNPFTTGNGNIVLGAINGISITTAQYNTYLGAYAGQNSTTGGSNTAIGANTLHDNIIGLSNVAVGNDCLNSVTSASGNNTGVGYNAGGNNITSVGGTFIGSGAGVRFTGGNTITAIGYFAGERLNQSANFGGNTYLGNQAESNDVGECVLGGVNTTITYFGRGKYDSNANGISTSYILSPPSVDATGNGMGRAAVTNGTSLYDFVIAGSLGTGTGKGGNIIFKYGVAGSTGSAQNTLTEGMRITATGLVGINASVPVAVLDIRQPNANNYFFSLLNTGFSSTFSDGYRIYQDNGGTVFFGGSGSDSRMRLDTNGRWGINVTAPSLATLQVRGLSGSPVFIASNASFASIITVYENGGVNMAVLPTTNAGLITGDFYVATAATILANGDNQVGWKV